MANNYILSDSEDKNTKYKKINKDNRTRFKNRRR